jgi:hypothetical protein
VRLARRRDFLVGADARYADEWVSVGTGLTVQMTGDLSAAIRCAWWCQRVLVSEFTVR